MPDAENCSTLAQSDRRKMMKVNDRVTVKTDGGPRRPGVVLAVEEFSEGTMYLVSLEDYPLGIWFFNESGHQDGIFVEKALQD
ncbi:protein DsrB [Salmonella bongori]|nr:protein DsrB [Salmonella bongori]